MENQVFTGGARALLPVSHRVQKEQSCFSSVSKQSTHVSTYEYLLNRQT